MFDPHCHYIPNITPSNPGKRINFVATPAAEEHPDQFAPYRVFGCDARTTFPGTLFRFPLRIEAHAKTSRISKQVLPVSPFTEKVPLLQHHHGRHIPCLRFVHNSN